MCRKKMLTENYVDLHRRNPIWSEVENNVIATLYVVELDT